MLQEAHGFAFSSAAPRDHARPISYWAEWLSAEESRAAVRQEAVVRGATMARSRVAPGDGAPWAWELANHVFAHTAQIMDRFHLSQHLWMTSRVVYGKGTALTTRLVESRENEVWEGR